MRITNALLEQGLCTIELRDGIIADVRPGYEPDAELDAGGHPVLPGLIDLHFHGARGKDSLEGDFAPLSAYLAQHGVTAYLPTFSTAPIPQMVAAAGAERPSHGAAILGFHMEGPFLSHGKKGAQNPAWLMPPDMALLRSVPDVRLVTVAPELPGALDMIRAGECLFSIGHTECDYDTAIAAMEAGACCLTHTFNAMPPMLHRAPGPIGAAVEKHIYAQLICDGFHVEKAAVLAAYKMFGPDRLVLISDSIAPAGLPDGEADFAGLTVVIQNGTLRLVDGTIAGSSATLWDCLKKAVEFGIPMWEAVHMASRNPADMLGIKKGRIQPGYDADLVLTNGSLDPVQVIIGGKLYKA